MKIMIVDDSTAMRMIVKKTLRQAGFDGHEFTEAEDGVKALAAIKASKPDLRRKPCDRPASLHSRLKPAISNSVGR